MQFIILVVQELRKIHIPKILTSEIDNIHIQHTDSKIPLVSENLIAN